MKINRMIFQVIERGAWPELNGNRLNEWLDRADAMIGKSYTNTPATKAMPAT